MSNHNLHLNNLT